jgi:hypothetical protein
MPSTSSYVGQGVVSVSVVPKVRKEAYIGISPPSGCILAQTILHKAKRAAEMVTP